MEGWGKPLRIYIRSWNSMTLLNIAIGEAGLLGLPSVSTKI